MSGDIQPKRVSIDIDAELFASAQIDAAAHGWTAAQQIEHWARLGRRQSRDYSQQAVDDVLAGRKTYDSLTGLEGIVVRALWSARFESLTGGVDLRPYLRSQGHRYAYGADDQGRVVRYDLSDDAHDVRDRGEKGENHKGDRGDDA